MRHQKSGRHLNRTSAHRKAMLSNMSVSLIEHENIKTTVAKAKELRRYVEPLITLSKTDSVANRRRAFAKLRSKAAVGKLFSDLGPRFLERQGGYTRILKAGYRRGDAAMVAYMQLVDSRSEETAEEEKAPPIESVESPDSSARSDTQGTVTSEGSATNQSPGTEGSDTSDSQRVTGEDKSVETDTDSRERKP